MPRRFAAAIGWIALLAALIALPSAGAAPGAEPCAVDGVAHAASLALAVDDTTPLTFDAASMRTLRLDAPGVGALLVEVIAQDPLARQPRLVDLGAHCRRVESDGGESGPWLVTWSDGRPRYVGVRGGAGVYDVRVRFAPLGASQLLHASDLFALADFAAPSAGFLDGNGGGSGENGGDPPGGGGGTGGLRYVPEPSLIATAPRVLGVAANGERDRAPQLTALYAGDVTPPGHVAVADAVYLFDLCTADARDDHGDTFACASTLMPGALHGATLGHAANARSGGGEADRDLYTFVLPTASRLTARSFGGLDLRGTLYDAAAQPLLFDDDGGHDHNLRLSAVLPAGRYFLRIDSVRSAEGSYALLLDARLP
ncbi:MAG: hypothetical protein AAF772_16830 [Acidobacteriota bacterium]